MAQAAAKGYASLERRVRALEQMVLPGREHPPAGDGGGRWWLLDRLATYDDPAFEHEGAGGAVVYGGRTLTPGNGEVSWQAEHPLPAVLGADLEAAAAVLGALGHTVRLEILRHLLLGGHTLTDLQQIPGMGTAGQLHHHLRELRAVGLVVHQRNHYTAAPDRVVPWLVMIAAAIGPARLAGARPDPSPEDPSPEQESTP